MAAPERASSQVRAGTWSVQASLGQTSNPSCERCWRGPRAELVTGSHTVHLLELHMHVFTSCLLHFTAIAGDVE